MKSVAENLDLPTEPYSERTLWRWKKRWGRLRDSLESSFWRRALDQFPHLPFPKGSEKPRTGWGWVFSIWQEIRHQFTPDMDVGCLQWLVHITRSESVTA